jgi:tetratricopeptide (TPR) repeat protein
MGPVTNVVLIFMAIILWNALGNVLDSNITLLWIIYNAMMGVGNLWPRRFIQFGQIHSTDGLQLFQIPFKKDVALAESLGLGPAGAIFVMYKDGDYLGAKKACLDHLQHLPGNPYLLTLLSACYIDLGDYEPARADIEPLLYSAVSLPPRLHAAVQNNLAVALWFSDFNAPQIEPSLQRADALTAEAYERYPCVLAHRSTHALLLAATNRSEQALVLLEYVNYQRASPDDRSHREIARAFALKNLGRTEEAEQALAVALKLRKTQLPYLRTIGLIS